MKQDLLKRIILSGGIILFFTLRSFAQIQGGVFDPIGKGIPNATIIATDSVRQTSDTVQTDKRGFYSFKRLRAGKYKIEAKAPGFITALFENVVANEGEKDEVVDRDDISSATRLEIVLKPVKVPK
jgi:hypothetical protein